MHTENTFTVETSQLREEILSILPFCYDIIFRESTNAGRKSNAILHKPYHSPLSWYRYRLSGGFGFVFFFLSQGLSPYPQLPSAIYNMMTPN